MFKTHTKLNRNVCFFSLLFIVLSIVIFASNSYARRGWQGCCSHHGGITYRCVNGRMLCRDGTLSPTCYCQSNWQKQQFSFRSCNFTKRNREDLKNSEKYEAIIEEIDTI